MKYLVIATRHDVTRRDATRHDATRRDTNDATRHEATRFDGAGGIAGSLSRSWGICLAHLLLPGRTLRAAVSQQMTFSGSTW